MAVIHPNDYRFTPVDPDPDFSEEHNREVIKKSIEETDKIAAQRRKAFGEQLDVRADAVARFIERVKAGAGNSDVKGYFGQKMINYLSGRDGPKKS